MNRNYRLKQSADIMRVRRSGKSYAHPLIVLIVHRGVENKIRIAVTAGRSVGNAVQRNRTKRMIREAVRTYLPKMNRGWDMLLISRVPILGAKLSDIQLALNQLFLKANLINKENES